MGLPGTPQSVEIVYRDDHVVVVNKPAGMLVHRTRLNREDDVFALQEVRNRVGMHVFPVHRLDRPTSGLLVFALDESSASNLGRQWSEQLVRKAYLAVVRGHAPGRDLIDYPIAAPGTHRRRDAVSLQVCLARTELCAPVGRYPSARYSLVALFPRTGRQHQLRRHMKHRFRPIVGDRKYGDDWHNRFFHGAFDCNRLLLHHAGIHFSHPVTGEHLHVVSEPKNSFFKVMKSMNWQECAAQFICNPGAWPLL